MMLDSQTRSIYLEELRPPTGYTFDCAIATTFTLDLLALLMAPLSFALFDVEQKDEILKDPVLVLEALRNTADKISIFCQDGYISVPKKDSLLFSYLEKSVIPVSTKKNKGIFHPKIWSLRYTQGDSVFYRFLCMSRNLTFDTSWDTLMCLEGEYIPRENGYSRNKPLSDFIRALGSLAVNEIDEVHQKRLEMLAYELHRVQFSLPVGFEGDYVMRPSGIPGYRSQSFPEEFYRVLVVSPFLTEEGVKILTSKGKNNVLVSRAETLDELSDASYNELIQNTSVYCLDDNAEAPESTGGSDDPSDNASRNSFRLKGLHAKIFHFNCGWYSIFINGSANATFPALNGCNVEFMVELTGKCSRVGIEYFTGEKDNSSSCFMKLLQPYVRMKNPVKEDDSAKKAEKLLDTIKREISSLSLSGKVENTAGSLYAVRICGKKNWELAAEGVSVKAYPITISPKDAVSCATSGLFEVRFDNLSLQAVTTFIAFVIHISINGQQFEDAFVCNIPTDGIPEDRNNSILVSIIQNKDRFIRYLLLILIQNPDAFLLQELLSVSNKTNRNNDADAGIMPIPLLEELLRAFSREPEKIERIVRLIDEIKMSDKSDEIIPPDFDKIWQTILTAYNEKI